jgi:Methyltransferase domain
MEYATLDVGKDLWEQGFEDRQYDLIVATNALHATKSLQGSLMNIRKLLNPNGRLLFQELCPSSKWVNYIFGVLPSWWCGSADGRLDEPYVGTKRWESELFAAGFDGIERLILDSEEPHQLTATIIARLSSVRKASKRVTLLCDDQGNDPDQFSAQLEKRGYEVIKCKIEDSPPPGQDVISLLDRDGPFFATMTSARFESFKQFLLNLSEGSGILWLTSLCHIGCQDPRYAQAIGLARTIRTEMLIDFATCEVDNFDSSSDKIVQLFAKFHQREDNDFLKPDFEYAVRNGEVQVGRLYLIALRDKLLTSEPNDKAVLDVGTPGRLNTLHWSRQAVTDLQSDEVEVEVYSVGLNFRVRP